MKKKQAEPQLSHRRISGVLRQEGYSVSPSTCYRIYIMAWEIVPTVPQKKVQ